MTPALARLFPATLLLTAVPLAATAQVPPQEAETLDAVEVVGQRVPLSRFPGAVDVVEGQDLRRGQRQVGLSETLARVPGVTVLERGNFAQDLQIQSRGFGARSTFGIRGIRLVVDGIPSSALDGQGQAANFPLGALDRIEVLRGPLALQYGNAAGGAIVGHTDLGAPDGASIEGWAGSFGSHRAAVRWDGSTASRDWQWRVLGSHFATDGERPHSAAERSQLSAVAEWKAGDSGRLRLAMNSLVQPYTQDPLGLTRGQWEAQPHGTAAEALEFNTRKRIDNHQFGLRWDSSYAPGREYWLGAHGIEREIVQFLSIPVGAQMPPSSSGGVIDSGRRSAGLEAGHRWSWARGSLAAGVELGRLEEARRGFENFIGDEVGVRGRLRRDEDNAIDAREAFLLGEYHLTPEWTALGGVRHSRLDFSSDDHYQAPGNGDDSGSIDYSETAASVGIARAFRNGEVFASAGRGFETPTVTELAYRPDGVAGLNFDLRPAHTDSVEVGARWRLQEVQLGVTAWRVGGDGEIVSATSSGGRSSYANAGSTRREGLEASVDGRLGDRWHYTVAANLIRARFTESFSYSVTRSGQTDVRTIEAGNRMPGIPSATAFAEFGWRTDSRRSGLALEARLSDRIPVDDANSDYAPGHAVFALRADWRAQSDGWHGFARVDNLFDREYAGSVIVNDGNGRFFEPGAGRSFTLGLGWNARR